MAQLAARLAARQRRAIDSLMVQQTIAAAAASTGVSRATLHRWLADETFCDSLRRSEAEAWASSTRRLSHLSGLAVDVLRDAMEGKSVGARQVRAAELTLMHGPRLRELIELEQRIAALEAVAPKGK
jgi:D-alanyl-D-alanine dipeptidase